jgi:hypothetical protein
MDVNLSGLAQVGYHNTACEFDDLTVRLDFIAEKTKQVAGLRSTISYAGSIIHE